MCGHLYVHVCTRIRTGVHAHVYVCVYVFMCVYLDCEVLVFLKFHLLCLADEVSMSILLPCKCNVT